MPTVREIVTFEDSLPPAGASPWVPGGEPQPGIEMVEYDPAWPTVFADVAARIREALGLRALAVEHVGSTAVPGLPAKPVIDVDLTLAHPADEQAYVPALTALGYQLRVREPWWYEHRCLRGEAPACNLHVFGPDAPEPYKHRIFRDWLRADPEDLALYRDTKKAAAEAANGAGEHTMQYNARKERVIREIYARAFVAAGLLPG